MDTICANCGSSFTRPKSSSRATCSKACRYGIVSANHRSKGIKPPGLTPKQREAARARVTGPNAPWWKGGRRIHKGYVVVLPPAGWPWPEMVPKSRYIREHRLVMAQHLGRPLDAAEVIHHENGDKTDNRIENLRLHRNHSEHMLEHSDTMAAVMRRNSASTRSVPAVCVTCGASYRTNARSTGECTRCRGRRYDRARGWRR